jgi:antitoxin FitA
MATLTLKNIPDSIYELLKEKAKTNRRSINNEVILLLQKYVAPPDDDVATFLEEARKLRARAKGMLTIEEIDEAKKMGRS